jgi:hypothetical protein
MLLVCSVDPRTRLFVQIERLRGGIKILEHATGSRGEIVWNGVEAVTGGRRSLLGTVIFGRLAKEKSEVVFDDLRDRGSAFLGQPLRLFLQLVIETEREL